MPENIHAEIHHFYPHPVTGTLYFDEEGDPFLGYYFQLISATGHDLSGLTGPYSSAEEAEQASQRAWETGDF
jgi:hypothetical protein